jgi:hypothetical protein
MKKLLKEPLLHFLLLGAGLFVLFDFVASEDAAYDENVIVVDRNTLLTFVQFRARAFEPGAAAAYLDKLQGDDLERLINDYVREEALHRQAVALGVDENDYVIKRRMIQSIEFITNGFVTAALNLDDEAIEAYFESNIEDYYIAPYVTYTHVFFEKDERGADAALALAEAKLAELNAAKVAFAEAPGHGDRFPYFLNYVERDPEFVASHFGPRMAEEIFALEPDAASWRGPLESPYGYHLVLLTRKVEGRYPDLEEVRERVRSDAEQAEIDTMQDKAIQAIVDTYEVRRTL